MPHQGLYCHEIGAVLVEMRAKSMAEWQVSLLGHPSSSSCPLICRDRKKVPMGREGLSASGRATRWGCHR